MSADFFPLKSFPLEIGEFTHIRCSMEGEGTWSWNLSVSLAHARHHVSRHSCFAKSASGGTQPKTEKKIDKSKQNARHFLFLAVPLPVGGRESSPCLPSLNILLALICCVTKVHPGTSIPQIFIQRKKLQSPQRSSITRFWNPHRRRHNEP